MRFSERQGIRPLKKIVQIDSMDDALRNRLWNVLTEAYWPKSHGGYDSLRHHPEFKGLLERLWHDHLKLPQDTIPDSRLNATATIRAFYFKFSWSDVYDFVEFVVAHDSYSQRRDNTIRECNRVLEQEVSAYRFVDGRLAPVTTKEEVSAIEDAIRETATVFPQATKHLRQSVDLLAQKPTPDHRNSIKESISGVESVCVAITGDPKATLGQALKAIDPKAELHGALKGAFEKLYGYTSDADGIRHALLEEARLEQEDAIFMLVACSAFISYVIAKRGRKT